MNDAEAVTPALNEFPWNLKPGDTILWYERDGRNRETEDVVVQTVKFHGTPGDDTCIITIKGQERKDFIDAFWPELLRA